MRFLRKALSLRPYVILLAPYFTLHIATTATVLCIRFDFSWCLPTDGAHTSWKVKIYHVSTINCSCDCDWMPEMNICSNLRFSGTVFGLKLISCFWLLFVPIILQEIFLSQKGNDWTQYVFIKQIINSKLTGDK